MGPHLDPFYITTGPDLLRSLHALLPTQVRDPQPCNTPPHSRLTQMVRLSMVTPGHHRSRRVATGSCKAEEAKLAPDFLFQVLLDRLGKETGPRVEQGKLQLSLERP